MSVDIETLVRALAGDDSICNDVDVILDFENIGSGIVCKLGSCARCYSADVGCYPYGPAEGVEYNDLPFEFFVPADECDGYDAWASRGLAAIDSLDIESELRRNNFEDFFENYLSRLDSADIEHDVSDHPMNANDMLSTYAQYIKSDFGQAVLDVADAISKLVEQCRNES